MQLVARLVGRGPSRLTRFFINSGWRCFGFLLSVGALRYLRDLLNTYPLLGWIGHRADFAVLPCHAGGGLAGIPRLVAFAAIDGINRRQARRWSSGDLKAAGQVVTRFERFYRDRPEMEWGAGRTAPPQIRRL